VRSREAYQDFLKCLNLYAQEIIPRSELRLLVGDILSKQGHSDLQARRSPPSSPAGSLGSTQRVPGGGVTCRTCGLQARRTRE